MNYGTVRLDRNGLEREALAEALVAWIGSKSSELGISLFVASTRSAHYQKEFWRGDSLTKADLLVANNAGLSGNPFVSPALLILENSL